MQHIWFMITGKRYVHSLWRNMGHSTVSYCINGRGVYNKQLLVCIIIYYSFTNFWACNAPRVSHHHIMFKIWKKKCSVLHVNRKYKNYTCCTFECNRTVREFQPEQKQRSSWLIQRSTCTRGHSIDLHCRWHTQQYITTAKHSDRQGQAASTLPTITAILIYTCR